MFGRIQDWVVTAVVSTIWPETAKDEKKPDAVAEPIVETPEEAAERLKRMNKTLASTAVIGDAILVELDRQDEKIEQIKDGMAHIEHNQKSAQKSIQHIQYGVVERSKDPKFQPKSRAPVKQRDTKVKTAPPPQKGSPVPEEEVVGINYDAVGLGESEKGLASLNDQMARLKMQATLMGSSIKGSHEELKKLKPRVETATEKNKDMSRAMQGMNKK